MTIDYLNAQRRQHGHKSPSENTEGVGIYSGFMPNANALQTRCGGMFAAVKEYFWPTQTDVTAPALTGRAIDVESAGECAAEQGHPERGTRYGSTIKCVVLAAAAAGIAATAWWVRSALYADGDAVGPNNVTPGALSAALATTALIGRRLLSAPTVINAIANQSVYANAPFNLQINLSHVFSWSGSLPDNRFLQANGAPLPDWLTLSMSIPPALVGSIAISNAIGVAVVDNYAYVANYTAGLEIIDVSNKASPILVGSAATQYTNGVTVVGNYAYVTDWIDGLKIIDVSNKANPIVVGSMATTVTVYGVIVVGNYAYVAEGCGGLKIVDVTNKASPILVGSMATTQAWDVTVVGNYAYVADWIDGLKIIDVSNKANPFLFGSMATTGAAYGVTVVDNYAYVADDIAGLLIIDVSNKANPFLVGNAAITFARVITVVGNYAYVADGCGGLKVIDVTNKAIPTFVGSAATQNALGLTVVANYAYVVDGAGGLKIFSSDKTLLSGTPSPLNRGVLPIKLTITDTLGETASAYFSITVLNNPPTASTIATQIVHRAFNWTITSFSDSDGDALTYSATLADGAPLPDWVLFNPTTRTLSGVAPPVVTVRTINIQADDSYGGITTASQTISVVNAPPIAGSSALPGQYVNPAVPFSFSLDPDVFTDPDGDLLTYRATLANQQPLPNWLTFNQTSGMFTITAPVGTGSMSVIVTATDTFGATFARSFDLNVAGSDNHNNLPKRMQNPPDYSVGIDKDIGFQINNNTFFDSDNDPLAWSAFVAGGNPLPTWLYFNAATRFFFGTAPETPITLPINIQAEDWQQIPATANFNLFVEGPPQLLAPLSNPVATVGTTFKFVVPESTFQNLGIQSALAYSASLTSGSALPGWLTFDSATKTFTGTPGRKDTNAFSSRPLPMRLTASNSIGTASTDFIINVEGESNATLAIKIISCAGAIFTIAGAAYAKRNSIWEKSMECVYRLPVDYVVIDKASEYLHRIRRLDPEKVASVELLRNGKTLSGGMLLPTWLVYDNSTANITIDAGALKDQDGLTTSCWTVKVKNKEGYVNGLVWEEFDIKFVKQLSDANVDDELRDSGVAMQSTKNRRNQLHEPLIGAA